MKIYINALSARLGGGQTYLKNLLAHLPDWPDLEVHVFAPASLSLPDDRKIVRRTTRWPTENPLLRTLWEMFAFRRLLAAECPGVLFCPGGVVATRVPAGCRTVTMFRNMIPFDPRTVSRIPFGLQRVRNFLLRRALLKSMAGADLTIFISEHARLVIGAHTAVRRAVTIPHGIGESFKTAGRDLPLPSWLPAGPYLLYVSRFDVYKHQQEVIEGFLSLPHEARDGVSLVLVGEASESDLSDVQRLLGRTDSSARVVVTGAVPYADLPGAYRNAVANVFASSCENCPNILLEALASGRPLLSSNVAPMPEFAGDAVEYFDPFDSKSIAAAMRRVLVDRTGAEHLGRKAAAQSMRFDWSASAARTWQSLLDLAGK